MKLNLYSICISLLVLTAVTGCGQKEVSESPVVQDMHQQAAEEEQSINENSSVIETITVKNPERAYGNEEAQMEPEQEETAVTYPRAERIKNYEPLSTEDSWFLIGGVTSDTPYKVFVDPRTIAGNNGLVQSWSKLEFEETQRDEDGLSYQQVQINSSIDCQNRTYSYTDSKFYDGLGRLVDTQPTPYEPQPIIEGTVSAKIADFVCGYELNRPEE